MPWILWLYFLGMLGVGVYLVVSGWKAKAGSIEQN